MTPQEIFDKALNAVVKQGKKSSTIDLFGKEQCVYHKSRRVRCAIGHLVSEQKAKLFDDTLTKYKLGGNVWSLCDQDDLKPIIPQWFRDNLCMLSDIQSAHDRAGRNFKEDYISAMIKIAHEYKLECKLQ